MDICIVLFVLLMVPCSTISQDIIIDLTSEETIMNITSPNYPNFYGNNVKIEWQVIAPTGYRVMVQFNDFNLEEGSWVKFGDSLTVYHGLTNSFDDATRKPRLSGSSLPNNFTSIGSYLWLRFFSDGSVTETGFSLSVRAVEPVIINLTSEGTIATTTSPNYPNNYGNNLDILWQVIAPTGFRVMVQFNDFNLRSGDSLSVYHGLTNSWTDATIRAIPSGSSLPENISSIGSYLWLWFKTDSTWGRTGFSLMVSAEKTDWACDFEDKTCGLVINDGMWEMGEVDNYYYILAIGGVASFTINHAYTSREGTLSFAHWQSGDSGSLTVTVCQDSFSYGTTSEVFVYEYITYLCDGTQDVQIMFTATRDPDSTSLSVLDIQLFEASILSTTSPSTIIMNTTPLQTTTPESITSEASSNGSVQTRLSLVPILISTLASLSAIAILVVIVCLVYRQKRLKPVSSQGIATSGEPRESPGIKDNPTFESSTSVHDLQMSDVADCHGGNDPYIALSTPHDGPTVQVYQTLIKETTQEDGYEVPINGANGRTGPENDKTLHKFQVHPETDYEITHEYQDITNNVVARNNLNNESPVCGLQEHPETDYGITHEYQDPGIVGTNIPQYESQVQPETDYEAIHEYEDPSIIGKSIPQYESHIIGPTM